jgi:molybdopterin/thiamine biosynthesis adenylyltransferase
VGGVSGLAGWALEVAPGRTACWACVFPDGSPEPERGALAAVAGAVGSLLAAATITGLAGAGEGLTGRLVHLDVRHGRFESERVARRADCPACSALAGPAATSQSG